GDGVVAVGDAAGLAVNAGITVRGMEFALVSGKLAAKAVARCAEGGDFSSNALAVYPSWLSESPLWQDLITFAVAGEALSHKRLVEGYAAWTATLLERLFAVGPGPKEKTSTELWRFARKHLMRLAAWKDWKKLKNL
ncbi:MAG: hypothetical protein ACYTFG_17510, partial [Planctomycetota bacterium]